MKTISRASHATLAIIVALVLNTKLAQASADVTGTVAMLEVWRNGNVAFTLSPGASSCNGQFILNASDPGFKNHYAALLAAKKTGSSIRVVSDTCGPADNYGSNYNLVLYLYVGD